MQNYRSSSRSIVWLLF